VSYLPTFGLLGSSGPTPSVDAIRGEISIYSLKNGKEDLKVVSRVEGSWIDNLSFDGQAYWTKLQYKPFQTIPVNADDALPSDCNLREDLVALKKKDEEASQTLKNQLEDKQRYDSKLRKKWEEQHPSD